ncbi:MAG: segregation and condensation protein A [Nocardioidaceae bacterium]
MTEAAAVAEIEPQSDTESSSDFAVRLDVFEGPFDLLLGLIAKHKLDITEIALSKVTDDFLAYIKQLDGDLEQTTEFLVVAATLLDLKASRLLPQAEVEDEEDLALLETRDLLFARLLQYRAFKEVAAYLDAEWVKQQRRYPRAVGLEPRFAELLPDVLIGLGPEQFAELAAGALEPQPEPMLPSSHVQGVKVSVREQAAVIVEMLRRSSAMTFRALVADAPDTLTTVARFLAVLQLFGDKMVSFDQMSPFGELHIRWTGAGEGEVSVGDEFDEPTAPESEESDDATD